MPTINIKTVIFAAVAFFLGAQFGGSLLTKLKSTASSAGL